MDRPNKKKADVLENAEDADTGASSSSPAYTATNSDGTSSFPTKSDVAGSTSLTTTTGNCYDVFLSFRGPDTRETFTDHLYHRLIDAGIDTFRDDDELSPGEKIGAELLAAIGNSKILIPVLSETYGTSSWCLDELAQMMELRNNNGRLVLPIFYKVKPAEVRYQTGDFGKAFHERVERMRARPSFDPTDLEKWEKALFEVCDLKGCEVKGCQGKLVKSIVLKVLSELKKEHALVMPENLVGIGGHVEKIMKLVNSNINATLFIGIHGMGGIGKTTLAKTIYNRLSNQFMYRSFIVDIRESCQRNGLVHVQNQLIFDILNQKDQVSHKDAGIQFISSKLKKKKVLVLLDDVDHFDQLKALTGEHGWFSSGSRVLITTRNYDVLERAGVNHKYEHEVMNDNHSMVLFCRHAFRRSSPPGEFNELAHDVITTTGGLPLSLEVLGSLLCGKKIPFWRDTIYKLKKAPHKEVQEKLRLSYEVLDDEQKQIFLDIACLFIGTDRRIATYMWDADCFFPGEGIEVLIFMSLIKCGDDHVFRMHDQLRDLGRAIVREKNPREPHYHSRLWDFKEAQKVLEKNQGTNKIEAIDLTEGNREGRRKKIGKHDIYTAEQFKNLTSLRFLRIGMTDLSGDFENSMEKLKWLQWEYCPENIEVTNFHVKELVILELPGCKMHNEWKGWRYFMMAEKLKFLNLSFCDDLENTGFLSAFKNLEVLNLTGCGSLKQIDSSIGDMKALLRLDLFDCSRLRELPAEIGELKALEQLLLKSTYSLSALPDSITSLENLEVLDISRSRIEELPKGIGMLRKLRELRASWCMKLRGKMLESMSNLSSLQHLDFRGCYELRSLPDLPSSLTYLGVTLKESRKLPSLSHLVRLKKLKLESCHSLECIQVLPSALCSKCSQLIAVEESELPQSLNTPFELEYLKFHDCGSMKILDISVYIRLRALSIFRCEDLPEVRGIDKLIYLESLTVQYCDSIKQLDLPESKSLTYLNVLRCPNLVEIQGIDRLEFLTDLEIYKCDSLNRLLLPGSKSLKNLSVAYGCKKLAEMEISHYTSNKRLEFPESWRLQRLVVVDCENLAEIQGLDRLKFLKNLCITGCTSIERVLLPKSRSLKRLHAVGCTNLKEIEGLNELEFLKVLDISKCGLIKRLEFLESGRLEKLFVDGCENLVEIQGLDRSEFLRTLSISGCMSLKTIPELSTTNIFREEPCAYRDKDLAGIF